MKKYNKGIITLPFLLVFIIILFFSLSFLMLTMTFAHVTVTQYLTYSSARKLSLAGKEQASQLEAAVLHYEKLRAQFFKPTAHTGQAGDWFHIQPDLRQETDKNIGYVADSFYADTQDPRKRFYGIVVFFQALVLNLKIPFLSKEDSNQINEPIRVQSFLGREPSKNECENFHVKKAKKIKDLCNNRDCPSIKEPIITTGDNGC